MKRIIGALLVITFLNGCSLPLVGSLTSSGITGVATGNYQKSLVSTAIDFGVYESTGKTPGQHLYASLETKVTKEKLEKHFPDKDIKIKNFKIGWTSSSIDDYHDYPEIAPTQAVYIYGFKS